MTEERTLSTLRLAVVPSRETNDFAVECRVDGVDVLDGLGALGLDPDCFFRTPPAVAAGEAREVLIGRCDCGVLGCGDLTIAISSDGEEVVWHLPDRELRFRAEPYASELLRAAGDFDWETPDRTAARHVRQRLPDAELRARGLAFEWASGQCTPGHLTLALHPTTGAYRQILLDVPWCDDLERLVASALERLRGA